MTPNQMAELAARLHELARTFESVIFSSTNTVPPIYTDLDAAADLIAGMAQRVPLSEEPTPEFAEWVRYNLPAGIVIGDPDWWVPRLWRAVRNSSTDRQAHGIRSEK